MARKSEPNPGNPPSVRPRKKHYRVANPHSNDPVARQLPVLLPAGAPSGSGLRGEGEPIFAGNIERRRKAMLEAKPLGALMASSRYRKDGGEGTKPTNGSPGEDPIPSLVQIPNTIIEPYRHICLLEIWPVNGVPLQGTGWLAGPQTIITAGHCVYQQDLRSWASSIRVHIAVNGENNESYTVQESHNLRSVEQWTVDGLEAYDYGAVILPQPVDAGFFGIGQLNDADLQNLLVSLIGYPTTTPDHETMWGDEGFVVAVQPTQIYYDFETEDGLSGGPVFYTKDGKRYVVGIHNYGGAANYGTRISAPVFDDITAWKNLK
jgi:V8-like Glu-specific endopeptidase